MQAAREINRTEKVTVRFQPQQRAELETAAALESVRLSSFCRRVLVVAARRRLAAARTDASGCDDDETCADGER
ncbi:MAG: hypothetical protein ACRELD_02340 [Longimicrobiales bacterium]